jgi:hypothetical protein
MVPVDDGASPAPIDRAVLERMRSRFAGSRMFEAVEIVEDGNLHLRVDLSSDYYPSEGSARLEIRWYRNDDFTIHYREERPETSWMCRWDRHPNAHNSRSHFHPPPDASRTDAENTPWPATHRDVISVVLDRIEARIETLWEQH